MNERTPFFLKTEQVPTDPRLVFVILPFKNTLLFEKVIKPIAEHDDLELICMKADDLFTTGAIMQDIADHIRKASLVIADLTDRNPNVFYELGLAHAFKKPVILLAQSDEDVPSDLKPHRYYPYSVKTTDGIEQLEATLRKVIVTERDSASVVASSDEIVDVQHAKGNEERIDSEFLSLEEGAFTIWAEVSVAHDVVYPKKNNMYLVAHATRHTMVRTSVDVGGAQGEAPTQKQVAYYPNVFAIRRVPAGMHNGSASWSFWCTSDGPSSVSISTDEDLAPGWHLFTVVWSRVHGYIKFFIDEEHIGLESFAAWPRSLAESVVLGTWPGRGAVHWWDSRIGPWAVHRQPLLPEQIQRLAEKPPE